MPVTPPPAAGWHLNIGTKVFLLFLGLALAGIGSWLVVNRALAQLDGAAADINLYGSLRYLSQKIQLTLHEVAEGADAGRIEPLLGEFETKLQTLQGRRHVEAVDGQARDELAAVSDEWPAYRDAVRRLLGSGTMAVNLEAGVRQLTAQADKLLEHANRATWALSDDVTRLQEKTRGDIARLALVDAAILIFAFIYIRRRIARPLRELSGATLRFARGDYGVRSGFRSQDEIGSLAEAFDHMAEETEDHIKLIAADLDDIRRKESELRKLTEAIEHSPASVIITDRTATIEYVNPRFTEVSGYTREDALGRRPSLLKSGQTLPETYRNLWQTISSGQVWRGELLNRRKDGELFWENTQISPVLDATGQITHYVAVKEDITARKRGEQALAMLNLDLEQRVAARTQQIEAANRELQAFSHSVSHDLRTPLRAILGFAQAVEEEGGSALKGELPDYLRRIQAAAVRMGELIDNLLELGRISQVELMAQPVHIGHMAREILDGMARREPGRRVETEVDESIVVHGDPRLLRIAVESLLDNAWKFSIDRDPARIVFAHAGQDGAQVLMVGDNGAGFSMDYADRLFRPFQSLHAAGRFAGKGIGLATAKRVIDLHGGRIWAEGEPEQGARFYFELPESPSDAELSVFAQNGRESETQKAP
ncbi:MAG: multi-sensor signal transduction histidine kinase [Rhodocyclaceae bacterium]|nr:MAG: multi-sensor signal transduction histidine kinase [Rhodocyclaceae bacterium]TND00607.1 MAG: multi-sensor signal transduction histidine kinase [Rhodocyclaceae bacterium]